VDLQADGIVDVVFRRGTYVRPVAPARVGRPR
jgi:DNA-binding GntR family transcriptional regulator